MTSMSTREDRLKIENVKVVNTRDVDLVVRDFYGREHVLFPMKEVELPMLTKKGKKDDRCRTGD